MNKLSVMACAALACSAAWAGSTKQFFVLVPGSEDWVSSAPMISTDGGKTGKPMKMVDVMCGWYTYQFAESELTDSVFIFRDDDTDREDMLGGNGNWETSETPAPIPLKTVFGTLDSVFFVADESQKLNEDGWLYSFAEADVLQGTCTISIPWIVYDSDAKLHPAFSCYSQGGEGCQTGAQDVDQETAVKAVNNCIGLTPGIVETTLDPTTKKPKLTTAGKTCFIDEKYFNQLFTYTKDVNETSCYDMPVQHMERGGWWSFNSDYYMSPGTKVFGGFFPVENVSDEKVKAANPDQTPLALARVKRDAEGPVFYGPSLRKLDSLEGLPLINVYCNGPGWNKGYKCDGLFGDVGSTEEAIQRALKLPAKYPDECVLGWSCALDAPEDWQFYEPGTEKPVLKGQDPSGTEIRWTSLVKGESGGRNHHFCYETHAKFTYKPGLRLALRGSDDIWAFIDNKLAIDLGGVHLDAPGYVDLDAFEGASGKLVVGDLYDVDIFACDRRTTMSGLEISTNMFLAQLPKSAITIKGKKWADHEPSETSYDICYTKQVNAGTCGMATETEAFCDSITSISYTLVKGNSLTDSVVSDFEKVSTPGVYKGGIDLTNLSKPTVDKSKIVLPDGYYTLFVTIEGKSAKVMSFRSGADDGSAIKPVARAVNSSFTVRNDMHSALTISVTSAPAKFAVVDLQGRVVRQGITSGTETIVPNLQPGSYIVKVARETRRVTVR